MSLQSLRKRLAYSVSSVELPGGFEVLKAVRVDVLIDSQCYLDEEVHDHETLGTDFKR